MRVYCAAHLFRASKPYQTCQNGLMPSNYIAANGHLINAPCKRYITRKNPAIYLPQHQPEHALPMMNFWPISLHWGCCAGKQVLRVKATLSPSHLSGAAVGARLWRYPLLLSFLFFIIDHSFARHKFQDYSRLSLSYCISTR